MPIGDLPSSLQHGGTQASRIASTGSIYDHVRQSSDSVPSSLRPSNSLASLDLYVPPYDQRHSLSAVDQLTTDFGEFGVADPHRRRESFPACPVHPLYSINLTPFLASARLHTPPFIVLRIFFILHTLNAWL